MTINLYSFLKASDNLENADFSLNYQDALPSQALFTNDGVSVDQAEKNECMFLFFTKSSFWSDETIHLPLKIWWIAYV